MKKLNKKVRGPTWLLEATTPICGERSAHVVATNYILFILTADLKKSMKCIFSQFGSIVDVVSRRTYKLRGQAWVVFEDPKDAAKALKAMQGFPFFNKPIVSLRTHLFYCDILIFCGT